MNRDDWQWVEEEPGRLVRGDATFYVPDPPPAGAVPVDVSGWQSAGYTSEVPRCFARPDFGAVRAAARRADR